MLELKRSVAERLQLQNVEKVRLLYKKKPVGDAKSVGEVLGGENVGAVEFGVMVIGGVGAGAVVAAEKEGSVERGGSATSEPVAPVAQGESGEDVLMTDVFWTDLRGFLEQRVRSTEVAETAGQVFRDAWKNR